MSYDKKYFYAALVQSYAHSNFKKQEALAITAGISRSMVSEMLRGIKVGKKPVQEKIAQAFGMSLDGFLSLGRDILEGESSKAIPLRPAPSIVINVRDEPNGKFLKEHAENYTGVPFYEEGRLAAGSGGMAFDPFQEPDGQVVVFMPELQHRASHNLAALRVGGDSMEPTISKGGIVVVDLDDRAHFDRKIYVVNTPEEGLPTASVKRVRKWDRGFVLVSDNPNTMPEVIELDWNELCAGRVIWAWKNLEDA